MWSIAVALLPATVVAVWLFGPYALYLVFATAVASALIEIPFDPDRFSLRLPLGDGSAFIAGMILGLSLAPTSAWWVPIVGAALMVIVGKYVFGGLGNNIFNPALVARGILLLSWPNQITRWISPVDGATSATPLSGLDVGYLPLFVGNIPGSLGETSVVALLLGALFLMTRGLISWRVPVSVLTGAAVTAAILGIDPLFTVLSGSLMFGAVFMATDMVTSPTGKTSHLIYGAGCGFLTVVIRRYTAYPEGITFAFLLMNGLAYLMDRIGADPIFGQVEERKRRVYRAVLLAAAVALMALLAAAGFIGRTLIADRYLDAARERSITGAYPQATRVAEATSYDPAVTMYRVYEERRPVGYFGHTTVNGYGGPMQVSVVLDLDESVRSVVVGQNSESPTVGTEVRTSGFLAQFSGFDPQSRDSLFDEVESISGATVSSRAVIRAVERVLAAREEAVHEDVAVGMPADSLADGVYRGSGRGYGGEIVVLVTVAGERVTAIEIEDHSETPGLGDSAMHTTIERILDAQSLDVDSVSGATGSSRGLRAAVEAALAGN
ncbi:MAG: RnfABCDGE type electron transport complex subunit D [Spirochaetaceae bacterium]|nr:MAG: RnfABCDGE type electron transport complex subunit D [Spirochaetaceae bacterium]